MVRALTFLCYLVSLFRCYGDRVARRSWLFAEKVCSLLIGISGQGWLEAGATSAQKFRFEFIIFAQPIRFHVDFYKLIFY